MTKRPYKQKFREVWRTHPNLSEWLHYGYDDNKAFCIYCKTSITCKLSDLLIHALSTKHVMAYNSLAKINKLPTKPNKTISETNATALPVYICQDDISAPDEHLNDCFKMQCSSSHASLNLISDLSLAKCLVVISMAFKQQKEKIAQKTKLSLPIIEQILKYKDHIQNIFKYVPKAIRFITPKELNNIIAITEILKEFMRRLMCQNVKITNEELMLNARLLTKVFCVSGMQIDDQWTQLFRQNFQQSIPIEKPIGRTNTNDFYVRNILQDIQHRLDSVVVARCNEHLKKTNSDDLILICTEMFEKQYVSRKQTSEKMSKNKTENVDEECLNILKDCCESEQDKMNNPVSVEMGESTGSGEQPLLKENSSVTADRIHEFNENPETTTNVLKEESQKFVKTEEIEMEEYITNVNTNEFMSESLTLCMHEKNEFEEYMNNNDSNDMIEIYAEIDEDDNDNDINSMVIGNQMDKTLLTVDPGNENPDYTKAKLNLDKIKKGAIVEPQARQFPKQYWSVEHLPIEPEIKLEPNIHSENNENYRGQKEFEETLAMQSSIQRSVIFKDNHDDVENSINLDEQTVTNLTSFNETQHKVNKDKCINQESISPQYVSSETDFYKCSQLSLGKIKEEYIEVNSNEDTREEEKVFEEAQAMQTPNKHFYVEHEIKQELDESNDNADNNKDYRDQEVFKGPVELAELKIKQDPDETNANENYRENLATSNEFQYIANQEYYINNERKNLKCTVTDAEFCKYSQELALDQIKEEFIEINANEGSREVENVIGEPRAMQSSKQHFYLVPDNNALANANNNENCKYPEEFEESHAMESPTQILGVEAIEPEINHKRTETSAEFDKNEKYNDLEVVQDPQAIEYIIQQKYIVAVEHDIKQEPVETIVNPYQSSACNEHENLKTTPFEPLNAEVYDNVQNEEHTKNKKHNEIVTSYDILRNDLATTLKNGDHLKEQRALKIEKIFRAKPYGKLSCEILWLDPIIFTYMYIMSNKPQIFREEALCMSLQIVLGDELYNCQYQYSIQPEDLELYRQFVLLCYSTKYRLFQLKDIMKGIFNESEIKIILNNSNHILEEWRTFFNKHFISMLYRKAVYEILFEYSTRHSLISAQLDRNAIEALPRTTTKDIQQFLHSDFELGKNWPQRYNEYIRKKVNKNPNDFCRVFTTTDLSLNLIYSDIKERLPQIVLENVSYTREEGDVLNVNSDVSDSSRAVDRLNLNSSKELRDVENDEQNSQQKNLIIQKDQYNNIYSKPKIMRGDIIIETSIKEPPNKKQKIDEFMQTVVSKNNSKDIQSVETSRDSEVSTGIELLPEDIHMNANPPETIEIAKIQKINKWDKSHFICALHNDPIIASYLRLSRLCYKEHLTVYSASILQKAFKDVFKENNIGKYSVCRPQDFQLYSKMLLFYYSSHRKYKSRITDIMICFDEKTIKEYLVNFSNIITEWRAFFENNLSRLLYKQAIYEMLFEYTIRYLKNGKVICDEVLIETAAEIQCFLRCYIILPEQWLENFSELFKRRFGFYKCSDKSELFDRVHIKLTANNSAILTGNYMDFHSIYKHVKYRLNYLVTDTILREVDSVYTDDTEKFSTSSEINANDNEVNMADEQLIRTEESIDVFIKEHLEKDPIIKKFFELSNEKTPAGTRYPIFTEDWLRLAFNEVLKKFRMRPATYDDYYLYRQLILFKYSEQCSSVHELAEIMKCFTVSVIRQNFRNYLNIIHKWHKVNENFLALYIFQQALSEMLTEYARRLLRVIPNIINYRLVEKFEEMKEFFGLDLKLPTKRYFYEILLRNVPTIKAENNTSTYTAIDFELETIYESIKSRLHSLVIEKREATIARQKKRQKVDTNLRPIKQCLIKALIALKSKSDAKAHGGITAQDLDVDTKVQNEDTDETSANKTNKKATSNMESLKEVHFHQCHNEENSLNDFVSGASNIDEFISIDNCSTEEIIEMDSGDDIKAEKNIECIQALQRHLKKQEERKLQQEVQKIKIKYSGHRRKRKESGGTIIETHNNRVSNQTEATTSKHHEEMKTSDEVLCISSDCESNDEGEIEIIIMNDDDTKIITSEIK